MEQLGKFLTSYGWFIGVPLAFIILVLYVFRSGTRRRYEKDARIPFKDEGHPHD